MENIVRLSEYRQRKTARRPAPPPAAAYFCTRCDSDEFKLSSAGMVHCAHCAALMRNLLVGATADPGPGGSAA